MHVNEETPLLPVVKPTPLPWKQFSIILLTQLVEPLTSQVLLPFAPQLVRDTGITNGDETKVGHYVGMLESLFFVTQAMTVLHWSRLSDRVGRKPVILIGLMGISVSMWSFGLSKSYWALVISRCINGALNGNVGILKSMMVEITDSTNRNEAFSLSPLAWLTGATLGPIIGGTLSQPANQFPDIFGNTVFFKEYPYFLACAVPALFAAFSWLVVFFFLQDTVKNPAPITTFFWRRNKNVEHGSHTTTSASDEFPLPLRALLTTRRIVIAASNYAFLALCQIAFFTLLPVFLSTPPAFGGPGLPPATIGMLLTISGVLNAVLRLTYMSQILRVCGPRKTHLAGLIFTFFGFATFPVLSLAARREFDTLVRALALFQAIIPVGMSFSNVAISLFIATSSPNKASIGATNGISQVTVSIFRAIGPAAVNSLYSISLARGYMGGFMVYYVLMLITAFSFWLGTLLPKNC